MSKTMTKYQLDHFRDKVKRQFNPMIEEAELLVKQDKTEATDKAVSKFRTEYVFDDYKFDNVFISLSPQYVPKTHWHYFTMFMMAYEEMTGKEIELISKTKYMFEDLFTQTTEHIVK